MSHSDEEEYWRLQTAISQVEAMIANAAVASNSQLSSVLLSFTESARKRVDQIEHGESLLPDNEKRQRDAYQLVVVKYLVEKETALNAAEREQYGEFLSKDYFTKSDFGKLDDFYSKTWDRLSEGGKSQMSHRVWEGVRREEYQFSELPEAVKEREAQQVRDVLRDVQQMPPEMQNIPSNDRSDFINAWDSGQKKAAYTVLDRASFTQNVSVTAQKLSVASGAASDKLDTKAMRNAEDKPEKVAEATQAVGALDLTQVDISIGNAESKAVSPARLSEPKVERKVEVGGD